MDRNNIMIFAGTSEGRLLAEQLGGEGVPCVVSVATEYGAALIHPKENLRIEEGRKSRTEMADCFEKNNIIAAVDATHPFAVKVSEEIRGACGDAGIPYIRLARDTGVSGVGTENSIISADSMDGAALLLNKIPGNIFASTGSKEIVKLARALDDASRLYVRVLPTEESLKKCAEAGISLSHVIAMQGPFSEELNEAMFRETHAAAVLMKESGRAGGEDTKVKAALKLGIKSVIIRNPENRNHNDGLSYDAVLKRVREILAGKAGERFQSIPSEKNDEKVSLAKKSKGTRGALTGKNDETTLKPCGASDGRRTIILAGIGNGGSGELTRECEGAVRKSDIVFGSERALDFAKDNIFCGKNRNEACPRMEKLYQGKEIYEFLEKHAEFKHPVVLLSGDTGFFSGAAGVEQVFEKKPDWDVRILPGISSVSSFSAKLGIKWQDAKMISVHGRAMDEVNPLGYVRENRGTFILVSGPEDVRKLGQAFMAGVGDADNYQLAFGTNLGLKDEKYGFCTAEELSRFDRKGLTIIYVENPGADSRVLTAGIPDDKFVRKCAGSEAFPDKNLQATRGECMHDFRTVPMTKEEVRVLSLSRLRLTPNAVLWDIGAGTGSVSVEAARLGPGIRVYAVEMRDDALKVMRENCEKFGLRNVFITKAEAPQGLDTLPAPTHVFVGGSSGRIRQILESALAENPRVRIVINTVTMETQAEAVSVLNELPVSEPEVRVISVTRAQPAGHYHIMKALNPVTVIDCEGIPGNTVKVRRGS